MKLTSNTDYMHTNLPTKPSTPVTWTFWARADNAGDKIHTELFGGSGYTDIALTQEWTQYTVSATTSATQQVVYFGSVSGRPVYLKWPCLVEN